MKNQSICLLASLTGMQYDHVKKPLDFRGRENEDLHRRNYSSNINLWGIELCHQYCNFAVLFVSIRSSSGDAWYRAQTMLQDQKIGHYLHVSPQTVFFSQVFGAILGVPINHGVIRWVPNTKPD